TPSTRMTMASGPWSDMRVRDAVVLALVLGLLTACTAADAGSGDGDGLATAQFDTLPGGTVTVTNAGPTAWADTSGWRFVEEGRLGGDNAPDALINPNAAALDAVG